MLSGLNRTSWMSALGWATFLVLHVSYLVDLPTWLFFFLLLASVVVACITSIWPLGVVIVYALMDVSVRSELSPYQGVASLETLWPVRVGVAVLAGLWIALAYSPRQLRIAQAPIRRAPVDVLRGTLIPLAVMAVAVDAYRYRDTGIPLFASNVDALRGVLREDSSLIVGLLRESWTLGALIAIVVLLVVQKRRPLDYIWAAFFAVGAFSGGSRNALLIAVVPPILAGIIYLRARVTQGLTRRQIWQRLGLAAGALVVGASAAASLMFYAGQRVLNGTGSFERDFQALYAGNPWGAAMGMTNLSLSSPLETWSRLYELQLGQMQELNLNVLAAVAFLTRPFGFEPDLYQITAELSSPYYMTVATFMGAPMRDFGLLGALGAAAVLGVVLGLLDRYLQQRRQIFALLGRSFVIYLGIFSVYEFQPFLYLSWLPVAFGLVVLSYLKKPPVKLVADAVGELFGRQRRENSPVEPAAKAP
ncbi:hypothetical protein [Cryobacterium zongtaii]|nr:hypothetical protein [Cryobacterium zongtaii]